MSFVIGRGSDAETTQTGHLGRYRALDGSEGAKLFVDLDGPHAMLIVGKRGYGKSFTLGVVAEELARSPGVAPVIVDPMGVFATLAEPADGESVPIEVVDRPAVAASVLDPRSWCSLLGLSPESGAGGLVWQAAQEADTLEAMSRRVEAIDAPTTDTRAATNHLSLAESWEVFDPEGLDAADLASTAATVVDVSGLDAAPMNAVCRGIGEALYRARIDETIDRLPWLMIDEAHLLRRRRRSGAPHDPHPRPCAGSQPRLRDPAPERRHGHRHLPVRRVDLPSTDRRSRPRGARGGSRRT